MKKYLILLTAVLFTAILSAQNVGINTNTPQATLDVNGTMKVATLVGADTQMVVTDTNGNFLVRPLAVPVLQDGDTDTKVQVEENADEDIIRFDIGGTEKLSLSLNPNGELQMNVQNGNGNLFIGSGAGAANTNTSFDGNTFIGRNSGAANEGGDSNTFLGDGSGESNINGFENVYIGADAGSANTAGTRNTFIGHNAGVNNVGSSNVYIGEGAGFTNDSGSNNIFIGQLAGTSTGSNRLHIGSGVPLIYGEFDTDLVRINGDLNIDNAYTLPSTDGNAGQFLTTDGLGNTSWGTAPASPWGISGGDVFRSSGKVAMGTSTVASDALLMVNGNIRVADDADLLGVDIIQGFNDLRFQGDGTGGTDFQIQASGLSGIGGISPNVALDVNNFSSNSSGAIFIATSAAGSDKFQVWDNGDVFAIGNFTVTSGTKNFLLDHPLDPENKHLYHNAVESPDHVTYYHGTVVLDANGSGTVDLPSYFEALNTDFHYQLTCVGGFAQVYVAEEIANNKFVIAGGNPGLKVSWQVSATRNDPWAQDHPYQAEVDKKPEHRGKYWYPEGYGKSKAHQIGHSSEKDHLNN